MTDMQEKLATSFVSLVLVVVLGSQAVASLFDTGRRGWPIVTYPMYKTAHHEGEPVLYDARTYAVLSDGRRIRLTRDDLGMSFWVYWYNVVLPIQDRRTAALRPLIERYCEAHAGEVVRLELEDMGLVIGHDGPTEVAPRVFANTPVRCSRGSRS